DLIAERYYFAFVSPNLLIRGVFTAVMWLTRGRPGHHLVAFSDVAQASLWLQAQTGHTPLAIRRLYDQAVQEASGAVFMPPDARAG
ncbi:MAG: hypothetical protein RL033_4362, partial [Pseudomonadota bacterium]